MAGVPVLDQREGLVGDLLRLLEELAEGGLGLGSLVLERKNSEFNFPLKSKKMSTTRFPLKDLFYLKYPFLIPTLFLITISVEQ